MVNTSKLNDVRFWQRWEKAGALGNIATARRNKPEASQNGAKIHGGGLRGRVLLKMARMQADGGVNRLRSGDRLFLYQTHPSALIMFEVVKKSLSIDRMVEEARRMLPIIYAVESRLEALSVPNEDSKIVNEYLIDDPATTLPERVLIQRHFADEYARLRQEIVPICTEADEKKIAHRLKNALNDGEFLSEYFPLDIAGRKRLITEAVDLFIQGFREAAEKYREGKIVN